MNPIYSHLYLDLQHKTIDSINLKQYDYEARYIRFHITDNGNPYILTPDIQAEIKIHKPDDTKVVNFAIVDCDSNHITVEITAQMTSMYGILHADISLFREGKVVSTMPFLLNVEKSSVQDEDIISSDEYGVLEDLITEVQTNECQRQLNEETRKEAESVRTLNEGIRKHNENIRIENEYSRKEAETDRENSENIRKQNENNRISNEGTRQTQETDREEKTSAAIQNSQQATQAAIDATIDLQDKLDSHHFVLTEDKDVVNGVPSLDTDRKIPIDELRDATTESKGIVQLTDSVTSSSTTTAATPNSVKVVYDALNTEKNRLNNVENKSSATIRSEITKSNVTNALGYTPYTPNEVDNKLSALETNIDWKESVNTFNDIVSTYPNPQDGWTVNVKDTDYSYRYNGSEWVAISANAIPKATNNIDGLLSKEDHTNYDDANSKKHTHNNKAVLDSITEDTINNINNITAHTHDDRYYTETEVNNLLSGKANSNHTHTKSQITDFPSSLPASDVYAWAKAKNKPAYTWDEIDSKPSTFTPSAHTHDDRYYTESEVDTKLAGKAAANHTHNYLPLSGGTMNGTLKISQNAQLQMENWGIHAENDQMLKIIPKESDCTMTLGVTDVMWTFAPWKDGMYQLGTPNHKFNNVYANNGMIVTSDRNKKTDIKDISNKYLDFFSLLQPVTYRFKDGSSGRIHVGFISQDVETAMNQTGLSDLDFAGFCKDKKQREVKEKRVRQKIDVMGNLLMDEIGNPIMEEYEYTYYEDDPDRDGNPIYIYSLRYEEFIALNTAVIQRQQAQITDLEQRLEQLEQQCVQ